MGREPKGLRPFLYLLRLALRGIGDNSAELRGLDRFVEIGTAPKACFDCFEDVHGAHPSFADRAQIAAIVWISVRNGSWTSRSTRSSVLGGYFPSRNILENSNNRIVVNSGIDWACTM